MKVCTDSCLFGAYVADYIQHPKSYIMHQTSDILDIGTGTGLLSLMLAQKTTANIDAIEIDEHAFEQATINIENSVWKNRIHVFNLDAVDFRPNKKYDLIISNPPFFEDDLKSDEPKKNKAKHDTGLSLQTLLNIMLNQISDEGNFCVLLPYHRTDYFVKTANLLGFYLNHNLSVRQTSNHNFFRSILIFSKKKLEPVCEEMSIKNNEHQYSPKFIFLLKDYYLNL